MAISVSFGVTGLMPVGVTDAGVAELGVAELEDGAVVGEDTTDFEATS
jgi:hypothetical protein